MSTSPDVGQALAASETPGEEFRSLPADSRREVFFALPETLQRTVVEDLSDEELRSFVRGLDHDEAADVLELANEE